MLFCWPIFTNFISPYILKNFTAQQNNVRDKYCIISLTCEIQKIKQTRGYNKERNRLTDLENKIVFASGEKDEERNKTGAGDQEVKSIHVKVAQLCQTFCDPIDYLVHGILQGRILEWVASSLLQGIFPTQESNPGLLRCRWILCRLSHQGSPRIQKWVPCPFSSRFS